MIYFVQSLRMLPRSVEASLLRRASVVSAPCQWFQGPCFGLTIRDLRSGRWNASHSELVRHAQLQGARHDAESRRESAPRRRTGARATRHERDRRAVAVHAQDVLASTLGHLLNGLRVEQVEALQAHVRLVEAIANAAIQLAEGGDRDRIRPIGGPAAAVAIVAEQLRAAPCVRRTSVPEHGSDVIQPVAGVVARLRAAQRVVAGNEEVVVKACEAWVLNGADCPELQARERRDDALDLRADRTCVGRDGKKGESTIRLPTVECDEHVLARAVESRHEK